MKISRITFAVFFVFAMSAFDAPLAADLTTWLHQAMDTRKNPFKSAADAMQKQNEGNMQAATAGDPFAQFWISHSYTRKDSPLFDMSKGIRWLKESAESGHADAQIFYAGLLEGNHEQKLSWLGKAARHGSVEALFLLDVFEVLDKLPRGAFEASGLLEMSARAGNVKALGILCRYGMIFSGATDGHPIRNCEDAAKGGSSEAMLRLGMLYERRMADFDIVPGEYGDLTLANFYLRNDAKEYRRDMKKAQSWYERAAAAGNPKAQARLARFLSQNLGGTFSLQQAFEWAKKSAAQGEAEGLALAGLILVNERLGGKEAKQGLDYLIRAAERGNPAAMIDLIVMYAHGQDAPRDLSMALAWYYLLQEEFDIERETEGYTDYLLLLPPQQAIADLKQLVTSEAALKGRRAAQDLREDLASKGFWPFRARRETYALTY
ncbi:MAG: sel1 repeat family protein [Alphaproteobacteria bacterium]|nr:sel1 repeat family protein [Alphaproteobacteria bacterium]